jgi:two-component system OmpR family response regulator
MRVLVVEDEKPLARAVCESLEEEGFAVDVAHDGESGLHKAATCEYDAIVLDVMLPELNGLDLLQRLRARRSTPVLILTARDSVRDKVRGLDLGADDYLTKPFALDELVARIRALIRRSAGRPAPLWRLGDVQIDTAACVVRKAGRVVPLTAKEYALVELLARHRGKVVTRTMIYDHIYDEHDETLSNVVDVYISMLRRKLGRDFIITRRGQGYVIDAEG